MGITAEQSVELKQLLAKVSISYYHWRSAGFPDDHPYHLHVAAYDQAVTNLR